MRGANAATADINTLSSGSLDFATLAAFITAHGATTVTNCYDKAGTNNLTQATAGKQPVVTANALNTSYGMTFASATNTCLATVSTVGPNTQPYSYVAISKQPTEADENFINIDSGFAGSEVQYKATGNIRLYSGSNVDTAITTAMHGIQMVSAAASASS